MLVTQWVTCLAQSVTCVTTDAHLTADLGVTSAIPARSHILVEINLEIISKVILLLSAISFKKVCCPGKSVVR